MSIVAYCLLDSDGNAVAASREQQSFYAASTMKLSVMAAVARLVDAGDIAWDEALSVRSVFPSAVAGAPPFSMAPEDHDERMPPDGTKMTVVDLVRAMVGRSSNEATDVLLSHVGLEAVASVNTAAQASGCFVQRLIGDTAAAAAGATNEVTPLGLARLMHAIVTGRLASPRSTAVMIAVLRAQEFPVIAEALPEGIVWGSKSGWVPGIEHDVAFIGEPRADAMRVLAVCTEGFPGRDARPEIERISAALLVDIDAV